ncbi:solute carrier family 23 member 3 isoform X2 [Lacerta agilis]|uniref:solute carrier family 23 member 3 isoform X2 n=1 Tax=Lacerta agilis TaxID=80427 RepID=UPI001419F64C|nr:solute carrier family 23 member 3 isoform X2 [Lacerta agilis]
MNKVNRASKSILPHARKGPKFPPWPLICLLALQHLLVQVSFLCVFHFFFIATLPGKMLNGTPCWNELLACNLFACGIATALQCGLGTRLPLVQAPSFEFLIPAMIQTQHMAPILQSNGNSTEAPDICAGPDCENSRNWDQLLHEVSGAVLISALVQVALGMSGACGWITHRCGPMVLAPSLSVIGLSAYRPAALLCSENWGVALLLVLLCVLLSQHLASCRLPICQWSQARGLTIKSGSPALHFFSILLPFSGIWLVCGMLRPVPTPWDVLHPSTRHLTLTNSTLQSPWFKLPYPGAQGWPVLSTRAIGIGAAMGVTASMNSVGCYLLCRKSLWDPPPPQHLCNRGLCTEGLGTLLSAVLGSVSGTASSMPNACAGRLTQAPSCRAVWISALACVLLGLSPRLMGILTTIPLAIHGCVPVDLFLLSLLMVPAFITGFLSFFLENTVSGTLQERGLLNYPSASKPEARKNSLQQCRNGSAQRNQVPLVLQKHPLPSWRKGFPFCFLCPLGVDKVEIVNTYPLEELRYSEEQTTDLLLKPETVVLESELELETVQEPNIPQRNLENHKYGRPTANEMTSLR